MSHLFRSQLDNDTVYRLHEVIKQLDVIHSGNALDLLAGSAFNLELLEKSSKSDGKTIVDNFKRTTYCVFDRALGLAVMKSVKSLDQLKSRRVTLFLVELYARSERGLVVDTDHVELRSISRQFNYLEKEVQFLFILVMCTMYDEIPDDKVKAWLKLLLTQPNVMLFVNSTICDVMFESNIVPDTLKQALILRILKEKKWPKLRVLLEWIETSILVNWIIGNESLIEMIWHKEFDQDTLMFILSHVSDFIVKTVNVSDKYYGLLNHLMSCLVEKPFMDVELGVIDRIARSNMDVVQLQYILALFKFDDVVQVITHLTQCEQLGVKINWLIGKGQAQAALLALSLIAQIWQHDNFNWNIDLPTETVVKCLLQSKQLSQFFNKLSSGHATIKTDHLLSSHLRLYSCVQHN